MLLPASKERTFTCEGLYSFDLQTNCLGSTLVYLKTGCFPCESIFFESSRGDFVALGVTWNGNSFWLYQHLFFAFRKESQTKPKRNEQKKTVASLEKKLPKKSVVFSLWAQELPFLLKKPFSVQFFHVFPRGSPISAEVKFTTLDRVGDIHGEAACEGFVFHAGHGIGDLDLSQRAAAGRPTDQYESQSLGCSLG